MKRYKGIPAWILILLLLLPGTVFAEERAKITVESLDRGMELYILEAGETTLKSVGKDAVLTFENIGDRIYFYAGAKTGYQIDRIWGDGISDRGISELSEEVTDPGAKEAYGLGCTKYFFFTHSESDPQRTIHIEGSPVQYQVAYEAGDADAPADEKTYTVEEGSNTITLAASPSKQGFRFAGWQLGENLYQPGDRVTLNGDLIILANESDQLVFRACWTQTVPYTVEYYLESEKGVYPQQPALQLECNTEAGSSVQADLAPEGLDLYGYVFDEKYEGNILSGIAADGAGLILRVYFALDANGNGIADRYEIPSEEPEEPVTPEEEPSVPEPGDGGETVPSDPEEGGTADPIPGPEDGENENEGTDPDPGTGDSSTRPSSDSERRAAQRLTKELKRMLRSCRWQRGISQNSRCLRSCSWLSGQYHRGNPPIQMMTQQSSLHPQRKRRSSEATAYRRSVYPEGAQIIPSNQARYRRSKMKIRRWLTRRSWKARTGAAAARQSILLSV